MQAAAVDAAERFVVTGCYDKTVRVWSIAAAKCRENPETLRAIAMPLEAFSRFCSHLYSPTRVTGA